MIDMIEPSTLLILGIVALVAGFIDAGGGGMLTVPALLSLGLPPHIALGTNKLAASFASSTAAWTYYRKQFFNPQFWRASFVATFIGAIIGTLIVNLISGAWLEKVLPLVIFAVAIYSLWHPHPNPDQTQLPTVTKTFKYKQWLQGSCLGFYDGLAGPGTGAFWTVSSLILYRLDMLRACGLAKAMNFTSNITSLVTFIILGHVNIELGLIMGGCLMIGAYLGAHSAIHFGAKFIRPVFITVVFILAAKLAWQAWF